MNEIAPKIKESKSRVVALRKKMKNLKQERENMVNSKNDMTNLLQQKHDKVKSLKSVVKGLSHRNNINGMLKKWKDRSNDYTTSVDNKKEPHSVDAITPTQRWFIDESDNTHFPVFDSKGTVLDQDMRVELAERQGLCEKCGIQTVVKRALRRIMITNDKVYNGICIKCFPTKLPVDVLERFNMKYTSRSMVQKKLVARQAQINHALVRRAKRLQPKQTLTQKKEIEIENEASIENYVGNLDVPNEHNTIVSLMQEQTKEINKVNKQNLSEITSKNIPKYGKSRLLQSEDLLKQSKSKIDREIQKSEGKFLSPTQVEKSRKVEEKLQFLLNKISKLETVECNDTNIQKETQMSHPLLEGNKLVKKQLKITANSSNTFSDEQRNAIHQEYTEDKERNILMQSVDPLLERNKLVKKQLKITANSSSTFSEEQKNAIHQEYTEDKERNILVQPVDPRESTGDEEPNQSIHIEVHNTKMADYDNVNMRRKGQTTKKNTTLKDLENDEGIILDVEKSLSVWNEDKIEAFIIKVITRNLKTKTFMNTILSSQLHEGQIDDQKKEIASEINANLNEKIAPIINKHNMKGRVLEGLIEEIKKDCRFSCDVSKIDRERIKSSIFDKELAKDSRNSKAQSNSESGDEKVSFDILIEKEQNVNSYNFDEYLEYYYARDILAIATDAVNSFSKILIKHPHSQEAIEIYNKIELILNDAICTISGDKYGKEKLMNYIQGG